MYHNVIYKTNDYLRIVEQKRFILYYQVFEQLCSTL